MARQLHGKLQATATNTIQKSTQKQPTRERVWCVPQVDLEHVCTCWLLGQWDVDALVKAPPDGLRLGSKKRGQEGSMSWQKFVL